MPCLNEARTIGDCIKKVDSWLKTNNVSGEILIGDNGSTDESVKIATALGAKVIAVQKKGYGSVLIETMKSANGEYIIIGDSDGSYDFSEISSFFEKFKAGYEVIIGNRFKGRIYPNAMPWKNRYIGNPLITFLGKVLWGVNINDFNCGLRGIKKDSLKKINLTATGMEFASEMIIKSKINNLKIIEVPVILLPDGRKGKSHLRPFRDGLRHIYLIISLMFQHKLHSR